MQEMVFPKDLPPSHPYYQFCGQLKGMKVILEECGLFESAKALTGGKLPGECSFCKSSHEGQERLVREAQSMAASGDKLEGTTEDVL
jgi:hypothetical protein